MTLGQSKKALSPSEVVESIGLGPSQFRVWLLGAGGMAFCDGAELFLCNSLLAPISHDLGAGPNRRAMLQVAVYVGILVGTLMSGRFGDSVGRRIPIVSAYCCNVIFGLLASWAPGIEILAAMRFVLAVGIGFGIPPSRAMLSEVTPTKWRIAMGSLVQAFVPVGAVCMALIITGDDPSLKHVNWRLMMQVGVIPSAAFGIFSILFLPESPVFLASIGDQDRAQKGFDAMKRLNRATNARTDFESPSDIHGNRAHALAFQDQLAIVFSPRYVSTTLLLGFVSFVLAMVTVTYSFAGNQILTDVSSLPAVWQMIMNQSMSILWCAVAGSIATRFTRKASMTLALMVTSTALSAFAFAGSIAPPRNAFLEAVFQFGNFTLPLSYQLGIIVCMQVAVEIYPTVASSTGGAVNLGVGRMGSIVVPFAFENLRVAFGRWDVFFYMVAALSFLAMPLLWLAPDIGQHYKEEEGGAGSSAAANAGKATKQLAKAAPTADQKRVPNYGAKAINGNAYGSV